MAVQVCTIIARNYLPAARVLAASFRDHHPDGRIAALIIDDLYGEVDAAREPFEVLRPSDLGLEVEEFHRMAMIYELMELATAIKPWLIEHLLSRGGADHVIYLDPDIRIYAPLDEVSTLAHGHGIVLTPHVTAPMPRDGKGIDETAILSAGIYNLGFIAVSKGSQPFLDFWKKRVSRECQVDPQNMRFVDQRWLDFVPGIFDCHILRGTSYNVAYWNIYQRDLRWTDQGYRVDGLPLKFFHFSGFDVNHPSLLSKHQGRHPRVLLSESPGVARICSEYVAAIRASTREEDADTAYGFAKLPNGMPIDCDLRRLYRERLVHAELNGYSLPPDAFSADGAEELIAWFNSPAEEDGHRISRYLLAVHGCRRDLQAAFPDPDGEDYDAFSSWAQREAVADRLHPLLVPPMPVQRRLPLAGPGWAPATKLRPGICVAGYLRAELGVGQLGRLVLASAEEAGLETGSFVFAQTISRQQHPFDEIPATDLNVNIIAVNADQLGEFAKRVGPAFFGGRYTIGVWAWELEEFPESWPQAFSLVDEVWAISEFSRRAIAAATEKPVLAFPLPVAAPRPRPGFDRSVLGVPDGFLFLFCFDFLSVSQRKNPRGLIEAFTTAFAPGEGPTLVLKAINGEFQLAELEAMKLLAAARPDIMVIDRYLDDDENAALMDACDCYVSLHRSEGFGLTMAEAMALGKPVIATAYSGNLDFMDDDTAYLVPWAEGSVPEGCAPYRRGARWAEPDIVVAAQLMRSVVQNPEKAAAVGARAQRAVLGKHGLGARTALMKERFAHAQEVLATRSRASGARKAATPGHTQRGAGLEVAALGPLTLPQFARSRADLGSPTRHPRISRPVRRLIARVTAHSDAHRAEVDGRLADALLALETTVSQLLGASSEQLAGRARLDVHLRRLAERSLMAEKISGAQLETLSTLLHELDAELRAVPYMSDPTLLITTDAQGAAAIGYRGLLASDGSDSYAAFEDIFRGPQDFIRERMRPYLDLVRSHEPIVDIGCGRGEFLDLLAAEGIHATGVDLDPGMVDICRGKGYEVAAADALDYLGALDGGSLGTVFSAQFIEHLSPADLVEYLRDAQRVLRDEGVFIAETVNPHSIQAFKTFWTDLTHRAPIFPEVAVALCRSAGFESAIVMFPNGNGDLDHDRRSTGEYAVVARKGKPLNRSGPDRAGKVRAVPSIKGPAAPTA